MMVAPSQDLLDKFRREIDDKADVLDPSGDHYWKDITLGWAIANGLSPNSDYTDEEAATNAHNFALYVRYQTDMA